MNTIESLNDMARDIDEWGTKMFPVKLPRWGVLEEIGELTHGFLKRFQKIRDMEKDEVFYPYLIDAIADAGVYLLHDLAMHDQKFAEADFKLDEIEDVDFSDKDTVEEFLGRIAEESAWLLQDQDFAASGEEIHVAILIDLLVLCKWAKVDFFVEIERTWKKVKNRPWDKNRATAHLDPAAQ